MNPAVTAAELPIVSEMRVRNNLLLPDLD